MKEQRKGQNEGVAVKQQKNTEKHQFALQYRVNISNEFVKKLNKIHLVRQFSSLGNLRAVYLALSLALTKTSNPTWFMNSFVMDANPYM